MAGEPEPGMTEQAADQPTRSPLLDEPPAYHRALRDHFVDDEPELWRWFEEADTLSSEGVDQAEVELLKTAYRLDGGIHDVLTGTASLLADQLGIDAPITLYQELGESDRNARIIQLGDGIHIVFSGDILDLLTLDEQHAVLAHELAHAKLFRLDGGAFGTLDHAVHRLDNEAETETAITETARRLRLHTEVWADAVAATCRDIGAVISSIVKIHSGLRTVDPDAYLRQAEQILEADPSSSAGWTHPELHVRVACLAARRTQEPQPIVDALVNGPDDLDRLDLLGQRRIDALTGRVLAAAIATVERTPELAAYLADLPEAVDAEPLVAGELADAEPSIRFLAAALFVDVALVGTGTSTSLGDIESTGRAATDIGVGVEFDKILAKATERTLAEIRKART